MVRIRHVVIGALVVIIGIVAATRLFQSEEGRVRKRLDLLTEYVSKDSRENTFTTARKTQKMATLFADKCELKTQIDSLSGSFTPREISSEAARARLQLSRLSARLYDVNIDFPQDGMAKVTLTVNVTGRMTNEVLIDETHEVECALKKIENKWLFSRIEVVEVLRK